MAVTLIFPTGSDPRSPQLALPYLAAALRGVGEDVELLDLNLGGLLAVLEAPRLARAAERLRKKYATVTAGEETLGRLLALRHSLPERAADALAVLRHPEVSRWASMSINSPEATEASRSSSRDLAGSMRSAVAVIAAHRLGWCSGGRAA